MSSDVLSSPPPSIVDDHPAPPVWWRVSGPDAELVPLTHWQCRQLLGRAGTGQLSFLGSAGTTTVATRYDVRGASAVVGPLPAATVEAMTVHQLVLFQVDQVDLTVGQGWTVTLVDLARSGEYVQVGLRSLAGRRISAPRR